MAKMYYDQDADLSFLDGKTIGIVGYGSRGQLSGTLPKDGGTLRLPFEEAA